MPSDFRGTLDGKGFHIFGLQLKGDFENGAGLIQNTKSGAKIQNLGIQNFTITNQASSLLISNSNGGLIGDNHRASIAECYATYVTLSGYKSHNGGLVGINRASSITNSYVIDVTLSGDKCMNGGLIGLNGGTITNTYATNIKINYNGYGDCNGGLIGSNSGTITNCYATNIMINSKNEDISGVLVGENDSYYGFIMNSYGSNDSNNIGNACGNNPKTCCHLVPTLSFYNYHFIVYTSNNSLSWNFKTVWSLSNENYGPPLLQNVNGQVPNKFYNK